MSLTNPIFNNFIINELTKLNNKVDNQLDNKVENEVDTYINLQIDNIKKEIKKCDNKVNVIHDVFNKYKSMAVSNNVENIQDILHEYKLEYTEYYFKLDNYHKELRQALIVNQNQWEQFRKEYYTNIQTISNNTNDLKQTISQLQQRIDILENQTECKKKYEPSSNMNWIKVSKRNND